MKKAILIVLLTLIASMAVAQDRVKVQSANGTIINPAKEDGNLSTILGNQTDGDQKTQVTSMPTTTVQGTVSVSEVTTMPTVTVVTSGTTTISAASLPLPTGAATELTLADILAGQTDGSQVVIGNKTPSDTFANPSDATCSHALISLWNSGTSQWQRALSVGVSGSGHSVLTSGVLPVKAYLYATNGTTYDQLKTDTTYGLDVDVTRTATSFGKTITYVPVSQGTAGTTQLAAAVAGNKHKIVGAALSLDVNGTFLFTDGTVATGAMPLLASTPLVLPATILPYIETAAVNRAISITTTGGKAFGWVAILTEP